MARMKTEKVNDPEFNWWEEKQQIVRVSVNWGTNYVTTDQTFTIDSGGLSLVAGDVLQVEETETSTYSAEFVEVSSVTSDTVIVVKRGRANTTPVAINDNAYLTRIGNVYAEGSSAPDISLRNPTKLTNYCQIFKTAFGVTGTAKEIKTRTGDTYLNDKKRKMFDHSVSQEFTWLFGKKYEDTSGTYPKRFCGGLRQFITTNVTVFTTTPTEDTFLDAIYPVFNYEAGGAGDERLVFCGNGFLNSLNKLARNSTSTRINFEKAVTDFYGMKLNQWTIPQGRFFFKTHPLMNVHAKWTNSAFILNPAGIKYRPLRDTFMEKDIQARGEDQKKDQWLTEAGIEVHFEDTMAYIGNFVV